MTTIFCNALTKLAPGIITRLIKIHEMQYLKVSEKGSVGS